MESTALHYGNESISFEFEPSRTSILGGENVALPLSDAEMGELIEETVESESLESATAGGGSILFIVPDATRNAAAGQVLNLLVRRLIASGTAPHNIAAIFATGIHRPVNRQEKDEILTPFLAQRVKTIDHSARDLMRLVKKGETSGGITVELNRALTEFDHIVTVGAVNYHYFAGFTGGRKLICPGLASSRTISETHRLAFDFENGRRAGGVGNGKLEGNPVHEAFVEAASFAPPAFTVNTFVDDTGRATDLVCGNWLASHLAACEKYAKTHSVAIREKRELVVASCGGSPYDINLIQAHKALETASMACVEGGTIVLLAECPEGTGRPDFLDWFTAGSASGIAELLRERYQVNGQTAWSLLEKAERFDIRVATRLDDGLVAKMKLRKIDFDGIRDLLRSGMRGYIMPKGARFLPVEKVNRL